MNVSFKEPRSVETTVESGLSGRAKSSHGGEDGRSSRAVVIGRAVFVASLFAVAALLGFLAHHYLHQAEEKLARLQYDSAANHAVNSLQRIARNKLYGASALAKVVANAVPNVEDWPLIHVPGFHEIANDIVPTSLVGGLSVAPIVTPDQVAAFETFAYETFAQQFPGEDVALSDFGTGIWDRDCNSDFEDGKCHDTTGDVDFDSPFQILTPKFLHSRGNHKLIMLNVHHEVVKGSVVDAGITCAMERAQMENPQDHHCQAVSEMVFSSKSGAGAFVVTPIYPDGLTTTGFVFAKLNWDEFLTTLFDADTSGVDIVFSTDSDAYTYTILHGEVIKIGLGDHHDRNFEDTGREAVFLDSDSLAEGSVHYKAVFYANGQFYDRYHSNNPTFTAIGASLMVLFISTLFVLYDFFVHREFDARAELLDAKRQFVRFISHEVRTPLNSVVMGLTLLQEEITKVLGYNTSAEVPDEPSEPDGEADPEAALDGSTGRSISSLGEGQGTISSKSALHWHRVTQEVHTNAQSSIDVLNDILNYDKVESGTLSLELTIIPIWKLIQLTVEEFKLPIHKKRIKLDISQPEADCKDSAEALKVIGDSVRLIQVIRNLISNAVKFTPEHGSLNIRATWIKATKMQRKASRSFTLKNSEEVSPICGGTLRLEVQDSGAGMTEDQVAHLFRQGVQFNVNNLQAGQGSGLGLYIAMGIIEQHGGTLTADSTGLGKGTTFSVSLPLYEVKSERHRPESHKSGESFGSIYEQSPMNILVVDDSLSNRRLLSRLLSNRGHTCKLAENGQIALDLIRQNQSEGEDGGFDLILLDFEMPVLNGPSTAKVLREDGNDVFIVGITGNMLTEDVDYFQSCGANRVLPKPFKMDALEDLCMEYGIGRR